jgi:hypothetical protein
MNKPKEKQHTVCCFSLGLFVDCTTVFGLFVGLRPSISEIPLDYRQIFLGIPDTGRLPRPMYP